MRLGIVTGEFPPLQGGVGDYSHQLAKALAALGAEVHVLTDRRCAGFQAATFTLHPLVSRWSFFSLWRIRHWARQLKLDVLNVQYQAAAFGLGTPIHFLPTVAGVPTVVTFHDLRIPYLFPRAGGLRERAVTHLAQSAAGAITTAPADEAELKRRGVANVLQIPIGSNIPVQPPNGYDRAAWRAQNNISSADFLLGYFGFLNHSKGGDTLMRALATLQDRHARVKLVLIGGQAGSSDPTDIEFGAQVEKMIARYGLENSIVRTGFVAAEEVSAWLLACEAVALPYRDGVSLRRGSLMAALAHGCAVISTQPHSPVAELKDSENIRLIPPDSPEVLVLAITGLLHAPEFRMRLGAAARLTAQQFGWGAIAKHTLEFFNAVQSHRNV
jgi:glycosyltransferase involved in cell wall biosynthesis